MPYGLCSAWHGRGGSEARGGTGDGEEAVPGATSASGEEDDDGELRDTERPSWHGARDGRDAMWPLYCGRASVAGFVSLDCVAPLFGCSRRTNATILFFSGEKRLLFLSRCSAGAEDSPVFYA